MEEKQEDFFSQSRKELEQYVRERIWLLKLQAGEKTAQIVAVLFSVLVIGLLGFFILLFLSIMAGYYFSGITHSLFTGFGMVAGFYLLLLITLIFSRKWIKRKIMDMVIRVFFAKTEDDHEKQP